MRLDLHIFLKIELYTLDNGMVLIGMDLEFRHGLMGQSMRVIGNIIKQTDKESLSTQMVIFMMETGKTTRLMALEHTLMLMELNMKDIGLTICKMDKDQNHGMMVLDIEGRIFKVLNKDMGTIYGLINPNIKVIGIKI